MRVQDESRGAIAGPRDRAHANGAFEAASRTRFEEFASIRDDDAGIAGWSAAGLDARVRRFTGLWRPGAAGKRWLDAGCGAGTYTRHLFEHGDDVVGVDYSLPATRKARMRSPYGIGFRDVAIFWMPIAPPRLPWLQRVVETAAVRAMTRVVSLFGLLISHAFIVRGTKALR